MGSMINQQMGNYRLTHLLGEGSFADVYLGEHVHLGTQAAIKVLHRRLVGEHLELFRTEAKTIARLHHPHIVRVLDFGVQDNIPFLVMEYAPNGNLRLRHARGKRVLPQDIVYYVKSIAAALQYAHTQKLMHRDVKPENMLVGEDQRVLLSDFGLVQVVQSSGSQTTEEMAGTIAYMAPEQLRGKPRPASDQYALGIVVYEWLSGALPFKGTFIEIATQHMITPPPPLRTKISQVTSDIEKVVMKALAKEPQQRFENVQIFAEAFEKACNSPGHSYQAEPGMILRTLPDESLIPTLVKELPEQPLQSEVVEEPWSQSLQPTVMAQPTNQIPVTWNELPDEEWIVDWDGDEESSSSQALQLAPMVAPSTQKAQDTIEVDWMNFRWFIFATAILAPILFSIGFFFQISILTEVSIVMVAICLILGLLQTAHYDQWYWFIGFLLLCPITGLLYSVLNPNSKPSPPINLKQLILVLACLSYALFAVAIFINVLPSLNNVPTWWIYYFCVGFWLSSWSLGFIYYARLGGAGDWFLLFLFPLTAPFAGLIAVYSEATQPEKPNKVVTKPTRQTATKPKRKSNK